MMRVQRGSAMAGCALPGGGMPGRMAPSGFITGGAAIYSEGNRDLSKVSAGEIQGCKIKSPERACGRMAAAPGPPRPRTGPASPAGAWPGAAAGMPRPAAFPLPGPACKKNRFFRHWTRAECLLTESLHPPHAPAPSMGIQNIYQTASTQGRAPRMSAAPGGRADKVGFRGGGGQGRRLQGCGCTPARPPSWPGNQTAAAPPLSSSRPPHLGSAGNPAAGAPRGRRQRAPSWAAIYGTLPRPQERCSCVYLRQC